MTARRVVSRSSVYGEAKQKKTKQKKPQHLAGLAPPRRFVPDTIETCFVSSLSMPVNEEKYNGLVSKFSQMFHAALVTGLVVLLGLEPIGQNGGTSLTLVGRLALNLDSHILVLFQVASNIGFFG